MNNKTIYALISNEHCWEDFIIFLSYSEAENALKQYPKRRIEYFIKSDSSGGYIPSYLVTYGKKWNENFETNILPENILTRIKSQTQLKIEIEQSKKIQEIEKIKEREIEKIKEIEIEEIEIKEIEKVEIEAEIEERDNLPITTNFYTLAELYPFSDLYQEEDCVLNKRSAR